MRDSNGDEDFARLLVDQSQESLKITDELVITTHGYVQNKDLVISR